ncbi:MAG: hypothetical protein QCI82_09455 [Candidatus Thermoplasmatota archaeon]|nr:hypothetical protein [Candidatus Thermoplasmatota archaeon]
MISVTVKRFSLAFVLICLLSSPFILSASADTSDSLQDIEILPNAYKPIELRGFDSSGDVMHITITHKIIEGKRIRSIDMYMVNSRTVEYFNLRKQGNPDEIAMYYQRNISSRFERDYKCLWNEQIFLVLDNPWMVGDDSDMDNATAIVRVDYSVKDVTGAGTNGLLVMLLIILGTLIVLILLTAGIILFRKRKKGVDSFFKRGNFLYYALKGPDGNIFYFGPDQYKRMHETNSIVGFVFLGYTREIGGDIYNESGLIVTPSAYEVPDYPSPEPVQDQYPAPIPADIEEAPVPEAVPAEATPVSEEPASEPGDIPEPSGGEETPQ